MLSHRLMRYVDAVARTGSIRKAAAQLNVASSAVNRQILALEAELGAPLFQRLPRRMQPTAAGEVLLDHIRQSLKGFDRARIVIDEMKGLRRGEVSLVVMSGPAGSVVPPVLDGFHRDHPRAVVKLQVRSGGDIRDAVAQGEADLGLGFDLPRDPRLRRALACACPLGAVMRPGHPLAGRRTLQLSDCRPYPLAIADGSMAIRPLLDELAQRQGLSLDPAIETDSIEVMRRMAGQCDLVTFLTPFDILLESRAGQLVHVPFPAAAGCQQQLVLITRDRGVSPLAGLLIERFRGLLLPDDAAA